jgi:hypothetical protein
MFDNLLRGLLVVRLPRTRSPFLRLKIMICYFAATIPFKNTKAHIYMGLSRVLKQIACRRINNPDSALG